jgi:ATP-binding protein involved in chromosome partitioning
VKILYIASSKGGVGKSLVVINTAYAIQKMGFKAGLLDTDIAMPAIVKYLGLQNSEVGTHSLIEPIVKDGVQILSAGLMMEKDQPVVVDSDKRQRLVEQFIDKTNWQCDYLVIDTPPGATDELQHVLKKRRDDLVGVIVVTTPSSTAINEVRRSIEMFRRIKDLRIIGVVANMSGLECENCHTINDMFKNKPSAVKDMADEFGLDIIAELPIVPGIDDEPLHFVDELVKGLKHAKI